MITIICINCLIFSEFTRFYVIKILETRYDDYVYAECQIEGCGHQVHFPGDSVDEMGYFI